MPYTTVTRADLRARLQEKWESVPFWTDTEANFLINEALQWYNLYTGVWKVRQPFTTVANQVYYTTSSTVVYNARVEFNGKTLAKSFLHDIDNGRPTWESETTADGVDVPTEPQVWIPIGLTQIAIWPADATGSNGLLIDGVHVTPTLASDGATLDMEDSEIDAILGFALHLACFKDPGRAPRTIGWHDEFMRTVLSHNGRLNASDQFRFVAGLDGNRTAHPMTASSEAK